MPGPVPIQIHALPRNEAAKPSPPGGSGGPAPAFAALLNGVHRESHVLATRNPAEITETASPAPRIEYPNQVARRIGTSARAGNDNVAIPEPREPASSSVTHRT